MTTDKNKNTNEQYELTVIISHYNQEKHIAQTLDSVFAQKASFPFKVIITDDCSDHPQGKEIIREYAQEHDNIEVIFANENKGYLTNILRAKEKTKTKYFCLLDADDYYTDRNFFQHARDFLNAHQEYAIYESNVEVIRENCRSGRPYLSRRQKSGTYSKEMYLEGKAIPITQTTGMVLRNCIFSHGLPQIMTDAIGTLSERSFEGDTGRFIMHLKHGKAYYDNRIIGVYLVTGSGIWTSLSEAKKRIISAKFYPDYYEYYGTDVAFFVTRAHDELNRYLEEKHKEAKNFKRDGRFMDDYEVDMFNEIYNFCKQYESSIIRKKPGIKDRIRQILKVIKE